MAAQFQILFNSHFFLSIMGSFNVLIHQKLSPFVHLFWVSVSALFHLLNKAVFRVKDGNYLNKNSSNSSEINYLNKNSSNYLEIDSNSTEQEADDDFYEFKDTKEQEVSEFNSSTKEAEVHDDVNELRHINEQEILEFDSSCKEKEADSDVNELKDVNEEVVLKEKEEEYTPKFVFKFAYQTYREEDEDEPVVTESLSTLTSTNKYEFLSSKESNLYLEKPEVFHLIVKELYADSFATNNAKEFVDKLEDEAETCVKRSSLRNCVEINEQKTNVLNDSQVLRNEDDKFLSVKDFVSHSDSDSDSDSITSSHEIISRYVNSTTTDTFLSDKDFEDFVNGIEGEKLEDEGGMEFSDTSDGYDPDDFDEEDGDLLKGLNNLEESNHDNSDTKVVEGSKKQEVLNLDDDTERSEASQDSSACDAEWEHQELIEQLKMEIKKVRATGLPTILEDDESPKIMEDLKPWKIDEKFQHEDRIGELHKFYKSYREKMRKFDILNYQKMYALNILQSKDPLKSILNDKALIPALTSLLLLVKRKKSDSDPMASYVKELHSDLEMVYVGQMCLSWEILHWQYEKSLEMWDSDPYGIRRYNEVAGEFQQLQVLMQRFIENEPFEGPRVQNYVKTRCLLRNLLQVPVIREDAIKDRKARRTAARHDDNAITSDRLVEIMEESIRIFWQFVRADKDAHNVVQKSRRGTQIEPQDPIKLELLTEVRTNLQKKEKKLKEKLRSGNCILKKFQKNEEDSSDQVLYFFSQVDMKLVSRVLNMSKITTDQLIWCSNKLDKINFVTRKIHVEPSFLLFPC